MDRRKKFGISLQQLQDLKRDYSLGFVFDVQHAYEHDHSMNLAKKIIKLFGKRLHHFHISGSTASEIHWPVYCADNRKGIEKVLKMNHPAPIILEGLVLGNIDGALKDELRYISGFF